MGSLNHNLQHATSERDSPTPIAATVIHIRLRLCPHDHQPQWKMLNALYMYEFDLLPYEYEVVGVPQS